MLSRQILRLVELAEEAAGYVEDTDPAWAAAFRQAAEVAILVAEREHPAEVVRELRAAVAEIRAQVAAVERSPAGEPFA